MKILQGVAHKCKKFLAKLNPFFKFFTSDLHIINQKDKFADFKINIMNQKKLLLQMLPGFIPLFIFIVADEIWGTKIGLIVAIFTGIAELIFYGIKDKKFDKFILFDTLLLVALGGVSLIFENDVFFKLKPALIGLLTSAIIAISAFTPNNFLFNMSKRYMRSIEFNEIQLLQMKKSMKTMFYIFFIYTLLVFYSVWFMSKEAWAFVSGGLFYIIFGGYFLFEFIKNKLNKKKSSQLIQQNEEILPILNKNGEIIGKMPRSVCHSDNKYLHPVVHLHVFNNKGELYLQKRPAFKDIQANKWDTAVGGHVSFGEEIEISLQREAYEELGLKNFEAKFLAKYIFEVKEESEFVFSFYTNFDGKIEFNTEEVSDGKFWSIKEIERNLGKNIFTPNFELEFEKIIRKFVNQ